MFISIKTKKPFQNGLFANIFCQLLELLPFFKKNNIYPEFDITSSLYGIGDDKKVFPHYISHNYNFKNNNDMNPNMEVIATISNLNSKNDYIEIYFEDIFNKYSTKSMPATTANALFFEYFSFPELIYNEYKILASQYLEKKIMGLHYRGTDKMKQNPTSKAYSEAGFLDLTNVINILNNELTNREIDVLYIASDDPSIIPILKEKLLNIQIINFSYDFKIIPHKPYHSIQTNSCDKLKMGLSAIRDVLMLSHCNIVFKYCSQMSAFCKVINPNLEMYRLNHPNYCWFPESIIPLYKKK
jgi:hypothetical protein